MGERRQVPCLRRARASARGRILAVLAATAAIAAVAGAFAPRWAPLTPAAVHADSSFDGALFSLFNQDRAGQGVAPLQWSASLGTLAENARYGGCGYSVNGRAEDMLQRDYMSHTILDCGGQNVFDIMRADGVPFGAAAENLGYSSGITDPESAARWINQQMMASSEHAANILDPTFTVAGIGSWWTASGQTWSGMGGAQSDVVVTAAEFISVPAAAPAPPPAPRPAAAPARIATAPVRVVHLAVAARPATAAPPTAAPTAAPSPTAEADLAVSPHLRLVDDLDAPAVAPVAAQTLLARRTPPLRLEVTFAGALMWLLEARRRRLRRSGRRTLRRPSARP